MSTGFHGQNLFLVSIHSQQVDDWNEATFLGAAVGILITVSLAAAAAVVLVLVRNKVGKLLWIEMFMLLIFSGYHNRVGMENSWIVYAHLDLF